MLSNGVYPPHLTNFSALYLDTETRTFNIAPFKCCVNGLPEFSQLLLDFVDDADLQLILMLP